MKNITVDEILDIIDSTSIELYSGKWNELRKAFKTFLNTKNQDTVTDKDKLDIIKNSLITVLESEAIVDNNNSDAFKFGYLKGTTNIIIEYINKQQ